MFKCDCLIHPFQNDPGTSQSQRVMEELLSGAAKIDARTLADLLDYFVQLSRHVNYYDFNLNVSDWQRFFQKSIPFTLAGAINYKFDQIASDFALYNSLFEKKPSSTGLQLQGYFIFYHFINKINSWHLAIRDSELPIEKEMQLLIKDKLQQPVKEFIAYTNAAVKSFNIKRIEFLNLYENAVWNLELTDLYSIDDSFKQNASSKYKQLNNLYYKFKNIEPAFFNAAKLLSASAQNSLQQSLLPLKQELQKNHPPHLALLFAFLNMFRQLQDDLNGYTQKHLDFFYKEVLQLKSKEAIADKTHVLFEIQKQLKDHLIKKGTLVKDGKDNNKQEILFSLDEEIVVNKTEIAEVRTLFLNNQSIRGTDYVEGVYIANDARKADGADKDFKDDQPKNFYTVGKKFSKYSDPETKIIKPYPDARIGFILGSPVLFLQEGSTRNVDINLVCGIREICTNTAQAFSSAFEACCDKKPRTVSAEIEDFPPFIDSDSLFEIVQKVLSSPWYVISDELLEQALKKGISQRIIDKIRNIFLIDNCKGNVCCSREHFYKNRIAVKKGRWLKFLNNPYLSEGDKIIFAEIFKPVSAFKIVFSGEKKWIEPSNPAMVSITRGLTSFKLVISSTLNPDKEAVTFYSKDNLKEDFGTTQPIVKIELNTDIQIPLNRKLRKKLGLSGTERDCCLLNDTKNCEQYISLYHFFRNVEVLNVPDTKIDVTVCGLKKFIVQNDESLQDVNGPVYPFGVRPKVGSSFYIGCEEIFLKKWNEIYINLNWKNLPDPLLSTFFENYYLAYQTHLMGKPPSNVVTNDDFKIQLAILQDGNWNVWDHCKKNVFDFDCTPADGKCKLFQTYTPTGIACSDIQNFTHQFAIKNALDFPPHFPFPNEKIEFLGIKQFDVAARHSFIRITLECQDFQHEIYPFILARQMLAFGKLPDKALDGAVYYDQNGDPIVFSSDLILSDLQDAQKNVNDVKSRTDNGLIPNVDHNFGANISEPPNANNVRHSMYDPNAANNNLDFQGEINKIKSDVDKNVTVITNVANFQAVIPNEPWTPIIKNISLDYKATAAIEDITLIHLYPYTGTYKEEALELQPTLFPTFCDEGTLFLGLKELVPGSNLNILFQLAEATSDSESTKEKVHWQYLDNNVWKPLRKGFEILDNADEDPNDAIKNLTASGVIKIASPGNMTNDNTVMPKDLYWIKASIPKNSKAVGETIGIHPQAIRVTFTNDEANDKLRLSEALKAQSISKLSEADANVKSVQQPYDSFGGQVPEMEGHFYVRVSELLRHKGRAIQKFDYERLVLEAFPQVFKAKCINHSFALDAHTYRNDFPYAPGYVILAVIPDLNKLKAGNSFEPKVPVSTIEQIETYIRKRTSPFVRLRVMNPRYEEINFCLRVKLLPGKDENYYRQQIKQDLKEFLAPWAVGKYDKLTFGQCIYRSDIIRFLESRDYVDFINDFRMGAVNESPENKSKECPVTPRSILVAGEIEVCLEPPECDEWQKCYKEENERKVEIGCCTTPLIPFTNYCDDKPDENG